MNKASSCARRQAGFTLIELALALTVAGFLMAFFVDSFLNLKKETETVVTKQRLEKISDALRRYAAYNGVLPCPANRMLDMTEVDPANENNANTNYGVAHATCPTGAGRSGTVSVGGGVRIGMVPVKSLNLPKEFAADGWGTRFIYAATETMTTAAIRKHNFGAPLINITGFPAGNNMAFVLVSVGKDYKGGFRTSDHTANNPDLACNASPGLDQENCDDDATFSFFGASDEPGPNYFDDYITFRTLPIPKNTAFPSGAIVAFDLSTCPSTWSLYNDAIGRAIIGASSGTAYSQGTPPATALSGYSGEDFNLGDTGGFATRRDVAPAGSQFFNMPPYLDLRYCQKD